MSVEGQCKKTGGKPAPLLGKKKTNIQQIQQYVRTSQSYLNIGLEMIATKKTNTATPPLTC
jgi:hypothetical protein